MNKNDLSFLLGIFIFISICLSCDKQNIESDTSHENRNNIILDSLIQKVYTNRDTHSISEILDTNTFTSYNRAKYYFYRSIRPVRKGEEGAASHWLNKSASFNENAQNSELTCRIFMAWSQLFFLKGDAKKTLDFAQKAIESAEDNQTIADAHFYMGNAYITLEEYDKSAQHFLITDSLNTREATKIHIYNNLSLCYDDDYEKRRFYLEKSIGIAKKLHEKEFVAKGYYNLAYVILKLGNPKEALDYMNQSKEITGGFSDGDAFDIYGDILRANGLLEEAEKAYNKAIDYYKDIRSNVIHVPYYSLSDMKKEQGLYEESLVAMDSASMHVIQNYKTRIVEEAKKLEKDFEIKLRDKTISELEKEKQLKQRQLIIIGLVSLALLLLLLGLYLAASRKRLKAQLKTVRLEQDLFRTQMNPHFIFNAIAGIRANMLMDKKENAVKYLTEFAKLTRQILEYSNEQSITLEQELEALKLYTSIQQMRFNHSFVVDFGVNEEMEIEEILIPPLLLQPFFENAIEHGIKNVDYPGMINLEIIEKNKMLTIRITDNGVGLKQEKEAGFEIMETKSMSTDITKKRIDMWNKSTGVPSNFSINDRKDGKDTGVITTFNLALKYR